MPQISVKIPEELKEKIDSEVKETKNNKSEVIRNNLRKALTVNQEKVKDLEEKVEKLESEMNEMKTPKNKGKSEDEPEVMRDVKPEQDIDKVDKKIIYHACRGNYSYAELEEKIGVSRNTIYRRIKNLKEKNVLENGVKYFPNLRKLGLTFVMMGINVDANDESNVTQYLKKQEQVKFIWSSFGGHDMVAHLICDKNKAIERAKEIKRDLEKKNITIKKLDISVSDSYQKINFKDIVPTF